MRLSIFAASIVLCIFNSSIAAEITSNTYVKDYSVAQVSRNTLQASTQAPAKVGKSEVKSTGITYLGNPINLVVSSDAAALNKKVLKTNLYDANFKKVSIGGDINSKPQVIASLLSLSAPVCSQEAASFAKLAAKFPNIDFILVSSDTPFTLSKYSKDNAKDNIKNLKFYTDFGAEDKGTKKSDNFGDNFGTLITDGVLKGLNARAVFLLDNKGDLMYKQFVNEIATPPNYSALSVALKSLNK